MDFVRFPGCAQLPSMRIPLSCEESLLPNLACGILHGIRELHDYLAKVKK